MGSGASAPTAAFLAEVTVRSRLGVLYDEAAQRAFAEHARPDANGELAVDAGWADAYARPSGNLARWSRRPGRVDAAGGRVDAAVDEDAATPQVLQPVRHRRLRTRRGRPAHANVLVTGQGHVCPPRAAELYLEDVSHRAGLLLQERSGKL